MNDELNKIILKLSQHKILVLISVIIIILIAGFLIANSNNNDETFNSTEENDIGVRVSTDEFSVVAPPNWTVFKDTFVFDMVIGDHANFLQVDESIGINCFDAKMSLEDQTNDQIDYYTSSKGFELVSIEQINVSEVPANVIKFHYEDETKTNDVTNILFIKDGKYYEMEFSKGAEQYQDLIVNSFLII